MALCPDPIAAYKEEILLQHGLNVVDFRDSIKYPTNLTGTLTQFFYNVTNSLEDVLKSFHVITEKYKTGTKSNYFKYPAHENGNSS